jgi:hypothetical protein
MCKKFACFATVVLVAVVIGCGGGDDMAEFEKFDDLEEGGAAAVPEGVLWQPSGNEGTISGTVNFDGDPPKLRPISMDADAACAAKHSSPVYPDVVVKNDNGTLANVFIHVKSGLEGKKFTVPGTPAELDQNGCIYKPHVLGVMAGQDLSMKTSDDTTHNIHPIPKINREFNVSQPPGADPIVRAFSRPESSIPVKCNQHPWMRAYVHVVSHPFHAVTGSDGSFEIKGLPPGQYEIEAVHESYGASTQSVTVEANGAATAEFSYNAKQAYQPGSLQMMPAMVIHCCAD